MQIFQISLEGGSEANSAGPGDARGAGQCPTHAAYVNLDFLAATLKEVKEKHVKFILLLF